LTLKHYDYSDLNITSSLKPASIPTGFLDDTSQNLFMIDSSDNKKLQKSTDKGNSWVNIATRDRNIRSIWYDRPNELLYYFTGNNGIVENRVYKWDIAGASETRIGGGAELNSFGTSKVGRDVFLIGSTIYCTNNRAGTGHEIVVWKWNGSNWNVDAFLNLDAPNSYSPIPSYVVIVGTDAYFLVQNTATNTHKYLVKFNSTGPTLSNVWQDRVVTYNFPDNIQRGISYDGNDTLFLVLNRGGNDFLMNFTISTTTMTEKGRYDIALMVDRFTDSSVDIPFTLELGFDTGADKIYQITQARGNLNLISTFDFTDTVIHITSHFVIDNSGNMFELIELSSEIYDAEISHGRMNTPFANMRISDTVKISSGMFIQLTDRYSTSLNTPFIYKATFNFEDDDVGANPAGWTVEEAGGTINVIAELDGHKKVLELNDTDGGNIIFTTQAFVSGQPTGTIELWWRTNDANQESTVFGLNQSGGVSIQLVILADKFQYRDSGGFNDVGLATVDNTWYHIKLIFDCTSDTYDIWIDEIEYQTDVGLRVLAVTLDSLRLASSVAGSNYINYFDAIGYSWDPSYTVGNNLIAEGAIDQVVFEGLVQEFTEEPLQEVSIRSQAIEMDNIFPAGDFSGSSQSIINSLITTLASYITPGTLAAGQAMGTITFAGDQTLRTILEDFAFLNNFIWYLTPTGALQFNNGTIDSTFDITESTPALDVGRNRGKRAVNKVNIKGAIVAGTQVAGVGAEDLTDQQQFGINPFSRTISFLNTQSLCNIAETNILSRLGTQATIPRFSDRDILIGFIQPGETITFQFVLGNFNIPSGQFGIELTLYNARQGIGTYDISDVL